MKLLEEEEDGYYCLDRFTLLSWMGVFHSGEVNPKNFDYNEKLEKESSAQCREECLFLGPTQLPIPVLQMQILKEGNKYS